MDQHRPVLLDETIAALAPRPSGCYVDATAGRGGHSAALLASLGPDGQLLAVDRDPGAVAAVAARFAHDARVAVCRGRFSGLAALVSQRGVHGRVDGLMADLGVSSPQLDDPRRGFSFMRDGPLDMRMDPDAGQGAAEWIADAPEAEIAHVIRRYGEEPSARRIARAIVAARALAPLATTGDLVAAVTAVLPVRQGRRHPATRVFQAIRLHVNRELDELRALLEQGLELLAVGGRFCVISFHSLEDRAVKRFFRDHARVDPALARMPVIPPDAEPRLRLVGKAQRATAVETAANPRARSAILRAAEKLR